MAPAYVAVFTGSLHALKTLVNYGADLWMPVDGQTLLELAKKMGHEDIVLYITNCSIQRTESLTSLPTFFSKAELSPKTDVNSAEERTVIQGDNPTHARKK